MDDIDAFGFCRKSTTAARRWQHHFDQRSAATARWMGPKSSIPSLKAALNSTRNAARAPARPILSVGNKKNITWSRREWLAECDSTASKEGKVGGVALAYLCGSAAQRSGGLNIESAAIKIRFAFHPIPTRSDAAQRQRTNGGRSLAARRKVAAGPTKGLRERQILRAPRGRRGPRCRSCFVLALR